MFAIVPAGGQGSRLWPLSRVSHPKFLLDPVADFGIGSREDASVAPGASVASGVSLLDLTLRRLAPLSESVTVVGSAATRLPIGNYLVEPSAKNSLGAAALAARQLRELHGDGVCGFFPADHLVANTDEFAAVVSAAVHLARDNHLVTVGVSPSTAATGYGYIGVGERVPFNSGSDAAPWAFTATAFFEKPDAARARAFVDSGAYLWNSGMYFFRADLLLDWARELVPGYSAWLDGADPCDPELWEGLPNTPIDRALSEPLAALGSVAVVVAEDLGWSDVGDFAALRELSDGDGRLLNLESPGTRLFAGADVSARERVVVLGVPDVVVVRTSDATLVVNPDFAQRVGELPALLPEEYR